MRGMENVSEPRAGESAYDRMTREYERRRRPVGRCSLCGGPLMWRRGDDGNDEYVCVNEDCPPG